MNEMRIWCISDSHFGHDKMVEYCGRPKDFSRQIVSNLSKMCRDDDILIHLGDICMGEDKYWHNAVIDRLNCKKWLVRGNHDKKSNSWYLAHGWDFVCEQFTDTYFGKEILFSHVPQRDNGTFNLNIHGHLHNNLERLKRKEYVTPDEEARNIGVVDILTPKHKLIALEFTGYKPVNLNEVLT